MAARAGVNLNTQKLGTVTNDDRADWTDVWRLFPNDVAYVWHAGLNASVVQGLAGAIRLRDPHADYPDEQIRYPRPQMLSERARARLDELVAIFRPHQQSWTWNRREGSIPAPGTL